MAKVKIDIESLVNWALAKQQADVSRGSGLSQELRQLTGGMSATASLEAYLSIGTRVDGGGSSSHKVSPDAQRVAAAIDTLDTPAAALVVMCGFSMTPMEWGEEGLGHWEPVLDSKGRHKKHYRDPAHCRGLLGWHYEYVGYLPSDLDALRLQYMVWHEALVVLQKQLEGRLAGWDVTGPRRSAEPWNDAPRVIHHNGEGWDARID